MNQQSIGANKQLTLNDNNAQDDRTCSEMMSGTLSTPDTEYPTWYYSF
jgi:hypothetical protein